MNITKIDVSQNEHVEITVGDLSDESEFETKKSEMWTGTMAEYSASIKDKLTTYKKNVESWMLSWGSYL